MSDHAPTPPPVLDYSATPRPLVWPAVAKSALLVGIGAVMVAYGVGYLRTGVDLQRIAPFDASSFLWHQAICNYIAAALTLLPGLAVAAWGTREFRGRHSQPGG